MEEGRNNLSMGQKLGAIGLAVFAIFVVLIWSANLKNSIYDPRTQGLNGIGINDSACTTGNCQTSGQEEVLTKDTDGDGLTDWEEINIYNTSPYIEDSDSDGDDDFFEVKNGANPNCHKGIDCSGQTALIKTEIPKQKTEQDILGDIESLSSLIEQAEPGDLKSDLELNSKELNDEEKKLSDVLEGKSDAKELRELLINSGMSKEMLDQISDEILLESYKEILMQ